MEGARGRLQRPCSGERGAWPDPGVRAQRDAGRTRLVPCHEVARAWQRPRSGGTRGFEVRSESKARGGVALWCGDTAEGGAAREGVRYNPSSSDSIRHRRVLLFYKPLTRSLSSVDRVCFSFLLTSSVDSHLRIHIILIPNLILLL